MDLLSNESNCFFQTLYLSLVINRVIETTNHGTYHLFDD